MAATAPIARVQQPAPQFKSVAVVGQDFKEISLSDYKGKYLVLFFYPLDFTFVCPTEIIGFSDAVSEFKKLNTELIAASCDSEYSHLAWINTPRKEGGLGPVNFPIIADLNKKMARDYGVLLDAGHPLRGTFIIDGKGIVRHITMNDPPVGRSVDETLRLVQAYQYADQHGEVCPVGWKPGSKTMNADPVKSKTYFSSVY